MSESIKFIFAVVLFLLFLPCPVFSQNSAPISIVPEPHSIQRLEGERKVDSSLRIVSGLLSEEIDAIIAFELGRILEKKGKVDVTLVKEKEVGGNRDDLYIGSGILNPGLNKIIAANQLKLIMNKESFIVVISPEGMAIWGSDSAGLLYGAMAFGQLISSATDRQSIIPNCIIQDFPDTEFRAAYIEPNPADYPFLKEIVREVLPRCRVNALFVNLRNMAAQEGDEAKGLLPQAQMNLLCQIAMDREMELIPVVESFESSRWTRQKRDEASESEHPFWVDPIFFSNLLRMYIEALDMLRPQYFHVGFAQPRGSDQLLDLLPKEETDILGGHFLRLKALLEARNVTPILWSEMFLGKDVLKADALPVMITEDEARRRRNIIHSDEAIFCLKLGISKIEKERPSALNLLKDERYDVILMSDSDSLENRLTLAGLQTRREGYLLGSLKGEENRKKQIENLIAFSDKIWNLQTKRSEGHESKIRKAAHELILWVEQ